MLKKRKTLLAAAMGCLCLGSVYAATPETASTHNFYARAFGGADFLQTTEYKDMDIDYKTKEKYNTGYNVGAAIGYRYKDIRLEAALSYQRANIDKWRYDTDYGQFDIMGGGHVSMTPLMLNGYYDFNVISKILTPYIGLGVGVTKVNLDSRSKNYIDEDGATYYDKSDDSQYLFAFQAIAGLKWALTDRAALTLDYRYFTTRKGTFDSYSYEESTSGTSSYLNRLRGSFTNNIVNVGFVYSFC